jgi:hypothetical protein
LLGPWASDNVAGPKWEVTKGILAGRVILTVVGSVAMIAGAFLQWVDVPNGLHGTELSIRVL